MQLNDRYCRQHGFDDLCGSNRQAPWIGPGSSWY
jgi:hypothetical protein